MQRRRHERPRAPLNRGATNTKVAFGQGLRTSQTATERLLWEQLRGRRLADFKFRRQHVLVGYAADFYCPSARLVVELDGTAHNGREAYDRERSRIFESFGVAVLRFTNDEVRLDLASVLDRIEEACLEREQD
jgi:very-short-patch-repair endonuclease